MYFQQILQGIASNLMDSNLFQLKSSTFFETYRWVPVTWGFLPRHFQASVGQVFWEYQMSSLICVIGHFATRGHTLKSNMPKANYMKLMLSLAEARVKATFLQTQMFKKVAVSPAEFQKISDESQVLAYIRYKENLFKKLEKEGRQPPP